MDDRISEIKSILELLTVLVTEELTAQRNEIEALKSKQNDALYNSMKNEEERVEKKVTERIAQIVAQMGEKIVEERAQKSEKISEKISDKINDKINEEINEEIKEEINENVVMDKRKSEEVRNEEIDEAREYDKSVIYDDPVGEKVLDLRDAFSINDKIYFIRELFDDEDKLFELAVNHINTLDSFANAIDYLHSSFGDWDENSSAVHGFYMAMRRKFRK
jgi:hypothetical protein